MKNITKENIENLKEEITLEIMEKYDINGYYFKNTMIYDIASIFLDKIDDYKKEEEDATEETIEAIADDLQHLEDGSIYVYNHDINNTFNENETIIEIISFCLLGENYIEEIIGSRKNKYYDFIDLKKDALFFVASVLIDETKNIILENNF